MTKLEKRLQSHSRPYLSDADLMVLIEGTANSRYSKIKRLLAQGKLWHIRRGLYCLTSEVGYFAKPHPFELAQYIYGPSYISLESALHFHGLIPEAVYTITSGSNKRAKEFETPLGVFSYLTLPQENLFTEVELIKKDHYQFLMAKPWRAICDYIFCYKKDWTGLEPLEESLRINKENLPRLSEINIELLNDYYRHSRINKFLKGIQKELAQEDRK